MNIYELEKKATPGPWTTIHGKGTCFHEGNQDSVQKINPETEESEEEASTIAEFWPTAPSSIAKRDAMLTAHCRNNFLRALEALKEEHRVSVGYEDARLNASPHCPEICDVCKLIKELETIT